MKLLALLLALVVCSSAYPQTLSTQDSVSAGTRSEIAHVRELIKQLEALQNAADRRYEQRFDAQEKAVQQALIAQKEAIAAALQAAKEAVIKAETAAEKRFDAVNEFRAQQKDLITQFSPKTEVNQQLSAMNEKIAMLQQRLDRAEGKGVGADALWGYIVAAIGLIITITGAFYITRRVPAVAEPARA